MEKELRQIRKSLINGSKKKFYFWDWLQKKHPVIYWMIWMGIVFADVVSIMLFIKMKY